MNLIKKIKGLFEKDINSARYDEIHEYRISIRDLESALAYLKESKHPIYSKVEGQNFTYLGEGSYATAFKLGSYCFKITSDYADAVMSHKVKGSTYQHLVNTYEVLEVREGHFIIITEALFDFEEGTELYNLSMYGSVIGSLIRDCAIYNDISISKLQDILKASYQASEELAKDMSVFVKELRELGFRNVDFHSENIKLGKDGKFKLIDLGHYTSTEKIKIDKIY